MALLVGGALIATATPHPTILGERSVAEVVNATGGWAVMHFALLLGCFLGIYGVTGIVAVHEGRLGGAGTRWTTAVVFGLVVTACVMAMEAVWFPEIATRAPELLDVDGPIVGNWALRVAGAPAMAFPVGLGVLGWLAFREGTHRRAGIVLAATAGAFVALALPFVPYAGPLATVAFGGAICWWGWIGFWSAVATGSGATTP